MEQINSNNWKELLLANRGSSNIGNIRKAIYRAHELHPHVIEDTSFCKEATCIPIRLTYIINECTSMNRCKTCDSLINDGGKKTFCSTSCRAKDQAQNKNIVSKRVQKFTKTYASKTDEEKQQIKANRKATMKAKYGVEHNFNIEGFKEKRATTWQALYGTPIAQQSDAVKEKTKSTCEFRYGGPNPLSDPVVKDKWNASYIKNNGVPNPMQLETTKRKVLGSKLGINPDEVVFLYEKLKDKEGLDSYEYTQLVRILTEITLKENGESRFGKNWESQRGKYKKHVDHAVSIRTGFLNDIEPHVIAHIENLQLLEADDNLSKGSNDAFTIEDLYSKIKQHSNEQTKTS